jgi:AraC family transcriptional regulator, regulatory protein of adaptative response / DNA-3-methyladenine glycosylase II
MHHEREQCLRAVLAKDARFDGQFVTGVTSTGIYCRPSCPARTPAPDNMRFYPGPAAAHRDGLRACKRCLPDATPGSPEWNVRADVVARSVRLIADGLLDRADVPALSAAVGYSPRHLERLMRDEIGAGPLGLARAQRAQTARTLIERTRLPLTEVAWAAGFRSVRSFNETVRAVYGHAPRDLRARTGSPESTTPAGGYTEIPVRLAFRPPLQVGQLFGHLVATALPDVEEWDGRCYRRTLRLPHGHGILSLAPPTPGATFVGGTVRLTDLRDLTAAVRRARWLLDLDADPDVVDGALGADPVLEPLVRDHPGRRVPRTVDGAELAIRTLLGQQVSTTAARALARRVVSALGEPVEDPAGGLSRLFPLPEQWADAPDEVLRMPATRRRALRSLAAHLSDGLDLGAGADWEAARRTLSAIPGIGPWTTESIAMRGLGDPDAFLGADLGVRSAAATLGFSSAPALVHHAENWRPWRAYAVQHLWSLLPHPINDLPQDPTQSGAA